MKYEFDLDIQRIAEEISKMLFPHIDIERIKCFRSYGTSSKRTIARCHALGKAMQLGMEKNKGFYVLEFIARRFDKLSKEEQIKVIIHELMHIPKSFGGGFKHHNVVTEGNVKKVYEHYTKLKQKENHHYQNI